MAWLAKGKTHADLIKQLQTNGVIKLKEIAEAMLKVDRGDFAPTDPYQDCPQRIGFGATISAPHMHEHIQIVCVTREDSFVRFHRVYHMHTAHKPYQHSAYALEELSAHLKPGCSALDVGSGSGYLVACMAYMVGDKGKVVGIEHIQELYDLGKQNMSKSHAHLLKSKNVILVNGDGRKGYDKEGPYDCIHVGAAAQPEVAPVLAAQLKNGGKMVIPVELGHYDQVFRMYTKDDKGQVSHKDIMGVMYVPLTDEKAQRGKK